MKLLPSQRVLCTPYNHTPCHFMQSHIRKVYACLTVICHLHFWQNARATAVTRGWNGYRNKSQHRKSTLEKKILPRPFYHESGALATELSPTPVRENLLRAHCCFTSTETVQTNRDEEPRMATSTFTQLLSSESCGWTRLF